MPQLWQPALAATVAVVLQFRAMKQTPLADNLRRLRGEMSQDALADEAGVDRCTVNRIERGRIKHPGSDTLATIATALGVSVDDLLRDPEPATKASQKRGRQAARR